MFNVCPQCGEYSERKAIDPIGPFAVCPVCQYEHRFVQLPLFVVTGASGAGKSAICLHLPAALPECVALETDILWGQVAATAEDNYRSYHNVWLRVAKNIGQGGRPVVLCGTALPEQLEVCAERRYFTTVHYLALVCDDAVLVERLQRRPQGRSVTPEFVERMRGFNRWMQEQAGQTVPTMTLLDTTARSVAESVGETVRWVREGMAAEVALPWER